MPIRQRKEDYGQRKRTHWPSGDYRQGHRGAGPRGGRFIQTRPAEPCRVLAQDGAVALESAIAEGEGLRRDAARKMRDKGQVNGHQWLRGGGEHPADGGRNELRGRLRAHREPGLQGRKDYCQELHLRAREAQARQG